MSKSILITYKFHSKYLSCIPKKYSIDQWKGESLITRQEFLKRSKDKCALIIASTEVVDKELLDKAGSNLKVISTLSAGYDHIDLQECSRRRISVGNTSNLSDDAVAEYTIGLTLATIRRFSEASSTIKEGKWFSGTDFPLWMCGIGIKNSVVGFLGAGRIGKTIMKRILSFEPEKILYNCHNPKPELKSLYNAEYVSLKDLCSKSDIIILICSLNPSTHRIIGKEQFSQMKPTAFLINTSRGKVIDQKSLVEALKTGQIAGAGLDVQEVEPIPKDDPLLQLPNCLVLPHIATATKSTHEALISMAIDNALSGIENCPLKSQVI